MQEEKRSENIFETAGRLEKKKRLQKQAEALEPFPGVEETFESRYARCISLHDDLDQQVGGLFSKSGLSLQKLHDLTDNAKNFSDRDWKLLEEQKGKRDQMIQDLKQRAKIVPQEGPIEVKKEAPPPPSQKKRKVVTKKQWLRMQ